MTCLHYPDVAVAGVDSQFLQELGRPAESRGIGGTADYLVTRAQILFLDEPNRNTLSYDVDLYIAASSQEGLYRPSLLGRDILDQHLMIYAPRNGRLELHRD